MADKLMIKDPGSGNVVRFTDNGAKEDDFYPANQAPEPLLLDPVGTPYAEYAEIPDCSVIIGDEEVDDADSR